MPDGVIRSLNLQKGFGFLQAEKGSDDLFFHRSSCPDLFTGLREGQRVRFEIDTAAERPRVEKLWLEGSAAAFVAQRTPARRPERGQSSERSGSFQRGIGRSARGEAQGGQRPAESRARGPRDGAERGFRRGEAKPRVDLSKRPAVCERGFITKLVTISATVPAHGFVSADGGGREIRFEPSVVEGFPRFMMLKVGDYVEFAVREDTREYTSPENPPIAYYVRAIERTIDEPRTQLPRHPRSRRRKPNWR